MIVVERLGSRYEVRGVWAKKKWWVGEVRRAGPRAFHSFDDGCVGDGDTCMEDIDRSRNIQTR